jgi:hypothetical protein
LLVHYSWQRFSVKNCTCSNPIDNIESCQNLKTGSSFDCFFSLPYYKCCIRVYIISSCELLSSPCYVGRFAPGLKFIGILMSIVLRIKVRPMCLLYLMQLICSFGMKVERCQVPAKDNGDSKKIGLGWVILYSSTNS